MLFQMPRFEQQPRNCLLSMSYANIDTGETVLADLTPEAGFHSLGRRANYTVQVEIAKFDPKKDQSISMLYITGNSGNVTRLYVDRLFFINSRDRGYGYCGKQERSTKAWFLQNNTWVVLVNPSCDYTSPID